ncbi:MAG: hypothetical protein ABJC89_08980 [Acidobacteriota bacterium]
MGTRSAVLLLATATLTAVTVTAQGRLSKQDGDRFQSKLTRIVTLGNAKPAAKAKPQSTDVSDVELNSYLKFLAGPQVPVGIVDPMLHALGEGRVSGSAMVDLDAVRKQKQRGWLDPMNYLSGRLPVNASGRLTTKDGVGQFQLDSVDISGVSVPKAVLQELLSYYSKTPENPAGIAMENPFELPSRIREIQVGSGTSTIVQQ